MCKPLVSILYTLLVLQLLYTRYSLVIYSSRPALSFQAYLAPFYHHLTQSMTIRVMPGSTLYGPVRKKTSDQIPAHFLLYFSTYRFCLWRIDFIYLRRFSE